MSLLQVSWPLLWRQAAHRRHSQHHRGGQTCAGAWHTSSSIPPIPRPGGHQDALRLAITPTHHPRALAHHPCCLWSPVEASGGAAGFKSTDLSSIFSAAENSWIWLRRSWGQQQRPARGSSCGPLHGRVVRSVAPDGHPCTPGDPLRRVTPRGGSGGRGWCAVVGCPRRKAEPSQRHALDPEVGVPRGGHQRPGHI